MRLPVNGLFIDAYFLTDDIFRLMKNNTNKNVAIASSMRLRPGGICSGGIAFKRCIPAVMLLVFLMSGCGTDFTDEVAGDAGSTDTMTNGTEADTETGTQTGTQTGTEAGTEIETEAYSCTFLGVVYHSGDRFPDANDCSDCVCQTGEDGIPVVHCTEKVCISRCDTAATEEQCLSIDGCSPVFGWKVDMARQCLIDEWAFVTCEASTACDDTYSGRAVNSVTSDCYHFSGACLSAQWVAQDWMDNDSSCSTARKICPPETDTETVDGGDEITIRFVNNSASPVYLQKKFFGENFSITPADAGAPKRFKPALGDCEFTCADVAAIIGRCGFVCDSFAAPDTIQVPTDGVFEVTWDGNLYTMDNVGCSEGGECFSKKTALSGDYQFGIIYYASVNCFFDDCEADTSGVIDAALPTGDSVTATVMVSFPLQNNIIVIEAVQ